MSTSPIQPIDRLEDSRLDDYRGVRDRAWLVRRGLFVAEGRRLIEGALAAGYRIRSVVATKTSSGSLAGRLSTAGIPVFEIDRAHLRQLVPVELHQECLAAVEIGERAGLPEMLDALGPGHARVAVAEHVSNPDNVGSLFRNAHALGVDAIALDGGCADPMYRKALRTSMGAPFVLPFAVDDDWPTALRAAGFAVAAFTPRSDALALDGFEPPERLAMVFGDEGRGLRAETLERADFCLRIPMRAGADSLNVAASAAIVFHELCAARRSA